MFEMFRLFKKDKTTRNYSSNSFGLSHFDNINPYSAKFGQIWQKNLEIKFFLYKIYLVVIKNDNFKILNIVNPSDFIFQVESYIVNANLKFVNLEVFVWSLRN